MTVPYQYHSKIKKILSSSSENLVSDYSHNLDIFKDKPFWIWDKQQHKQDFTNTNGNCCFNHIVGLPVKHDKEYENWEGVNWLGIRIAPVTDHIEGWYYEQLKEPVFDPKTGEPIKYKRKGQREAYYIPFDKKTVDKIIKESTHSSQESISLVVKFGAEEWDGHGGRMGTRAQFTYDQFVNWTFKELYELNKSPVWNELADPNISQNKNKNIGPVTKTLYK